MFVNTTVRLFTGSFKALFADFDAFLRICWAWYALIAVLSVAGTLLFGDSKLIALPIVLVWLCASGSIAVAWHRNLLLRESPAAMNLRFGGRELRYVLKMFLVALMLVIPAALVGAVAGVFAASLLGSPEGAGATVFIIVVVAVVLLLLIPLLMRLSLVLPATALDEPLGFREAFGNSQGLGLPMALAGIGLALVVGVFDYALSLLAGLLGGGSIIGTIAVFILSIALQIATTALQIGVLTGGYYIFRERYAPGPDTRRS
jgi:hypothetical protein